MKASNFRSRFVLYPAPAPAVSPYSPDMSRSLARALLALSLPLSLAVAQPVTPVPADQPTAPAAQPFTLEDAIALALKKNFDLQIQGYAVENARENLLIARTDFLPTITASSDRSLSRATLVVTQPDGTTVVLPRHSNSTRFSLGVSERLPWTNGTLSLSTNVSRSSTQRPPFSTSVTGSLNQPLLRNSGPTIATANIERSKLGLNIQQINYRSRVLALIRDTENAYYNLVAARETLRIRQLTLDAGQRLFDENTTRRTTGVAIDLDVLSAEVGVANARRALVQAEQTVREREDTLMTLVNSFNPDVRPGPVFFEDYQISRPNFATSYQRARQSYPETLSMEQTMKQLEIDLATARRNRLPTLNLTASIGYNNTDDSDYIGVIRALPDDHGDERRLGLSYSMPWGMKADRARYRQAMISLNSQKARFEQLELSLLMQVRSAVRAVETNLLAVEIASKATELAMRQYEQQKARYDAGLSTSRQVLLTQDDLESARFNELNAKVQLRGAIAELNRLEGTSIERFRVQLPE
jgi:outer membrane protein